MARRRSCGGSDGPGSLMEALVWVTGGTIAFILSMAAIVGVCRGILLLFGVLK